MGLLLDINNDNDNDKPKTSPLWGTSEMEHTPFHLQYSKQKALDLQPLRSS